MEWDPSKNQVERKDLSLAGLEAVNLGSFPLPLLLELGSRSGLAGQWGPDIPPHERGASAGQPESIWGFQLSVSSRPFAVHFGR